MDQSQQQQAAQAPQDPSLETKEGALAQEPAKPSTEKDKKEVDLSAQFAALSRREKKLVEEAKRVKEASAALEEYKKAKAEAKKRPLDWLKHGELTVEDLIQSALTDGKPPTAEVKLKTVEEKLAALEERLAKKSEQENQENINRAVTKYKEQIKRVVDTDAAKFELIAANDAYELVFEVCEQYWQENGTQLPIEKAAELVEDDLFERAKKFTSLQKVKKLFTPAEAMAEQAVSSPDKSEATETPSPQVTLTNKQAPAVFGQPKKKPLSREESLREAAKLLKFNP